MRPRDRLAVERIQESTVSASRPQANVLRLPQVIAKTRLSRATIYALQSQGVFPPSFNLSARAVGWFESEIDAVLAARAAGDDVGAIRALISSLVAARPRAAAWTR
jgi:prophage regulatory protein